ncbi:MULTISPECIES: outer membrane protein [unclassified Paracoccus (in: a-proteobacteria)]|uniref:outer membrane protein n=1 Tax=unclassified Paracoccus (in: a-proteobacteria) TaxID=2688777 RepID=UPI0012B2B6D3|nr:MULTISPECIES: porin family protein [unclassified Paracoccus (in: a-proteobacteria)]UXU75132.1 porin family protein [Paracoccus sp. SMMA_5]UXU81034.1 porin family protein [Paracoccus sp. SMMA_5_TC]
MKAIAYAAATALVAGAAHAGGYAAPVVETPVTAPVVEPVTITPSGWTGFYAGAQYGMGSGDLGDRGARPDFGDFDAYGLHAGYQHGFGKFVLGGELDYNRVSPDENYSNGDLTRLRLRAGADMGKFQPYVTVGAAKLKTDEFSDTGMTYGLGVDYKLAENFSVGAEYTRNDFKDVLADSEGINGNDLDLNLVQLRASFRF